AASGIFVSSAKDANPSPTGSPKWGTLSWGGSVPANTTLNFQAAANNDLSGTFNFVGPDGTANSFFNNGDPLSQFNGLRYLKYEAFLNTSDSSVTPTVSEVTVCFSDVGPPSTPTPAPTPSPTPSPTPTPTPNPTPTPTPIPTIQVTVQTNPAGLSVTVDSTSYNAPQTFSWIPGS